MSATSLPLSAQELCERIRHSLPFDPSRLNRVLRVDDARALVEVQAGTPWRALAAHLRPGDPLAQQACAPRATVGRSVASNAAGPDGRPTVHHVESLTAVTPDGQLRRIDRISNPMLFSLLVGGHGLFGVLYSVTLRLESLARTLGEAEPPEVLRLAPPSQRRSARKLHLLVPPAQLSGALDEAQELCAQWRLPIGTIGMRRIRAERETFLRWAGRDCVEVALELAAADTLGREVRSAQLCRSLIDLAIGRGGAFPIACTPEATREQTQACYPQLGAFLAEQRRLDPQGRWATAWLRHQQRLLTRENCEVRWNR